MSRPTLPLRAKMNIYLPIPVAKRVRAEAEKEQRTISAQISYLLTLYFNELDKERR